MCTQSAPVPTIRGGTVTPNKKNASTGGVPTAQWQWAALNKRGNSEDEKEAEVKKEKEKPNLR